MKINRNRYPYGIHKSMNYWQENINLMKETRNFYKSENTSIAAIDDWLDDMINDFLRDYLDENK